MKHVNPAIAANAQALKASREKARIVKDRESMLTLTEVIRNQYRDSDPNSYSTRPIYVSTNELKTRMVKIREAIRNNDIDNISFEDIALAALLALADNNLEDNRKATQLNSVENLLKVLEHKTGNDDPDYILILERVALEELQEALDKMNTPGFSGVDFARTFVDTIATLQDVEHHIASDPIAL